MPNCQYLNGNDFKKTLFNYSNLISPDCKIQKYRNKYRISFNLPTGAREYYYKLDLENYKNEVSQKRTLREFEALIRSGYFPLKSISKLKEFKNPDNSNKTTIKSGLEQYYTKYNQGQYYKRPTTIKNQRLTLAYLLEIFQKKTGKRLLEDISTDDLIRIDDDLQIWCAEAGKPINIVTTATYKRLVKSYFNCLAKRLRLDMNPAVISSSPKTSGHLNKKIGARTVIIPKDLLDAVERRSCSTPKAYPDRKKMVHLLRRTGIAKAELATLGEENLYPSKDNFNSIILMDKPNCPTNDGIGFKVKSHNRHMRIIPLDKKSISFIKQQLIKHANDEIYGRVSIDGQKIYKRYRYLFPIFTSEKWQRCDSFLTGIQRLLEDTSKEFELGYKGGDYTVHDFRTTLNEEMGDLGISAEDRAYILGHSKDVNERNYMNDSKQKELKAKKAHAAFNKIFATSKNLENIQPLIN